MPISDSDIEKVQLSPPHSLQVILRSGKSVTIDVKRWMDGEILHKTLLVPAEFIKGYKSASGGIEWAHGPYLSRSAIADLYNAQNGRSDGKGDPVKLPDPPGDAVTPGLTDQSARQQPD
jgi:hypothetical protein